MDHVRIPPQEHIYAGSPKLCRIGLSFIAERVESSSHDERWRQTRMVIRAERGKARIIKIWRIWTSVLLTKPVHQIGSEEEARTEQPLRRVLLHPVHRRVDQQLCDRWRSKAPRSAHRSHRGQVGPSTVATYKDPSGITSQVGRVGKSPVKSCSRVFHSGWEWMLGGKAIVHSENINPRVKADGSTDRVVRVKVAENEATPVVKDKEWMRAAQLWS